MIYFKMFTYVIVIYYIVDELIWEEKKITLKNHHKIQKNFMTRLIKTKKFNFFSPIQTIYIVIDSLIDLRVHTSWFFHVLGQSHHQGNDIAEATNSLFFNASFHTL